MTVTEPKAESVLKPAMVLMAGRMLAFAATFFIPVALARAFHPAAFGTYKQLFLIQNTVFYIAQMGMATTLYYFLPQNRGAVGRYIANSTTFLGAAGLAGMALMIVAAPEIANWMHNDALAAYLPWMGGYLALTMLASPLEIVLIAQARYGWASTAYTLTDFGRAAAFITTALVFHSLDWLVKSAVAIAALRMVATLFYFQREFGKDLRIHSGLFRSQCAYAFPFAFAVMIEILQGSLPQYMVSYLTNPVAFAIFAVGCLQIPLVDLATSPASDVMMVKMQESIARGHRAAALEIWHDTTWKLALLFFPLTVLVIAVARETILLLYTQRYEASVPLFMAWSLLILTSTFQVDGVLRVFAQTRWLLFLNLVRLGIVAGLIYGSLQGLQLLGPVLVIVAANTCFKLLALVRMRVLLDTDFRGLLPWRRLAALLRASIGAAGPVLLVKFQVSAPPLKLLFLMVPLYITTYVALIWRFALLDEREREALSNWARKAAQGILPFKGRNDSRLGGLGVENAGD